MLCMKYNRFSDARAHVHHTLRVMRQQAVKAVRHGETADSVSKAMGVNIRTVFRWLADFSSPSGKIRFDQANTRSV